MTADDAGSAVTVSTPVFSASSGSAEKVSAKRQKVSASGKRKRGQGIVLAETDEGLQVTVDDETLFGLISAGRVGVHKNGSRQRKHGNVYDYRSHYRALRLNDGGREVLAFGKPERLVEKLAQIGVCLCFAHSRPQLSVGDSCWQCAGREAVRVSAARNSAAFNNTYHT